MTHPAFIRAAALSEPLRSHFPKTRDEAMDFQPLIRYRALSSKVLVVAQTRIETAWCAFVDAVPGENHRDEFKAVASYGAKVDEKLARLLFPEFDEVPYAS